MSTAAAQDPCPLCDEPMVKHHVSDEPCDTPACDWRECHNCLVRIDLRSNNAVNLPPR